MPSKIISMLTEIKTVMNTVQNNLIAVQKRYRIFKKKRPKNGIINLPKINSINSRENRGFNKFSKKQ